MSNHWTFFMHELLPPGLNQWQRMHYRVRARWIVKCADYVVTYSGGLRKFTGAVKVIYQRNRRNGPPMDDDNAYASFKPLGDALKKLEVIEDDGPKHLTLEVRQECVGMDGEWGTFLHIEPREQQQ